MFICVCKVILKRETEKLILRNRRLWIFHLERRENLEQKPLKSNPSLVNQRNDRQGFTQEDFLPEEIYTHCTTVVHSVRFIADKHTRLSFILSHYSLLYAVFQTSKKPTTYSCDRQSSTSSLANFFLRLKSPKICLFGSREGFLPHIPPMKKESRCRISAGLHASGNPDELSGNQWWRENMTDSSTEFSRCLHTSFSILSAIVCLQQTHELHLWIGLRQPYLSSSWIPRRGFDTRSLSLNLVCWKFDKWTLGKWYRNSLLLVLTFILKQRLVHQNWYQVNVM